MTTSKLIRRSVWLLFPLFFTACPSRGEMSAMDGVTLFRACDVRGANAAFDTAYTSDPTRADFALAYALTDVGLLVEDPALTALAPRLGFDRPIDSSIIWGHDGLLDRLSRGDTCDSVRTWLDMTWPHPALRPMGPDFVSTIDGTLTLADVRTALVAISPRLQRDAAALETAADGMGPTGVTLDGGCGVGSTPTRLQAPELYALAAGLEAIRAGTQATLAYDGAIPVRLLLSSPDSMAATWVATMNAHLLRPTDPSQLSAVQPILVRVGDLSHRAVTAARSAPTPRPTDSVFDWTALPPVVLDDVDAYATAIAPALMSASPTAIPRISPTLSIALGSFLDTPVDFGTATPPIWSVDSGGSYVQTDSSALDAILAPRFTPNPFASSAPSYASTINWSSITSDTWTSVFDPGMRWSHGYDCTSSP